MKGIDGIKIHKQRIYFILYNIKRKRVTIGLLRGACSSAWLERPAHNRVVKGSNPFGPIKQMAE